MTESTLLGLILASTTLTTVYWVCLIVGGGLVVFSMFGGESGDADVDLDADFDFDADGGLGDLAADPDAGQAVGAASLSSWFSMRFVVFFVAVFGAIGVVFTHMLGSGPWTTLIAAAIAGLLMGQFAHHIFQCIKRSGGNSATRPQDYVRKLARVTVRIADQRKGEVALQVRNMERFVPAVARGNVTEFGVGDEVVVVGYRGGVAQVISAEEFEQGEPPT